MGNVRDFSKNGRKKYNRLKDHCELCNEEVTKEVYLRFEGWCKRCFTDHLKSHLGPGVEFREYSLDPDWFEKHMEHLKQIRSV
jgi:hypothetical protein